MKNERAKPFPLYLLPALAAAVAGQWLLLRVLSRAAIYMPKTETTAQIFSALTGIGTFLFILAILLAALALARLIQVRANSALAAALVFLLAANALILLPLDSTLSFLPAVGLLLVMVVFAARTRAMGLPGAKKLALRLALGAYALYAFYLLVNAAARLAGWSSVPMIAEISLRVGEIFFVLAAIVFGIGAGKPDKWRGRAMIAVMVVGAIAALWFINASLVGILALWSLGLSLYLPAPIYALGLGAFVYAILATRDPERFALLLLFFTGYALLDTQTQLTAVVALAVWFESG